MATISINFIDHGARCDTLCRNSNVNCAVCSGRDYDQDEIISNSHPPCFAQDEISSSWLSWTDTIDKDDHHGRIWSWVFFYYHHYQTSEIVFWIIFHCKTKHPNFIFLIGIHFLMHSFYTKNSIYIEPNTTLISNVEIMSSCHGHNTHPSFIFFFLIIEVINLTKIYY